MIEPNYTLYAAYFLVTTESGCMADNGDQCIFPFRRPSDGTIVTDNTCFNGGCAIRLTDKARMKEAGACMPGCLGSNVLIFSFYFTNGFFMF